jgi:hypothetical protein
MERVHVPQVVDYEGRQNSERSVAQLGQVGIGQIRPGRIDVVLDEVVVGDFEVHFEAFDGDKKLFR